MLNGIDKIENLEIYSDLVANFMDSFKESDFSINDILEFSLKFDKNILEKVLNMKKGKRQEALLTTCLFNWFKSKENFDAVWIILKVEKVTAVCLTLKTKFVKCIFAIFWCILEN